MFGGGFVGPAIGAVGIGAGLGLGLAGVGIIGNEINQIVPRAERTLKEKG